MVEFRWVPWVPFLTALSIRQDWAVRGRKSPWTQVLSPILPCWVQAVAEDTILKASETCARGVEMLRTGGDTYKVRC